MNTKPIGPFLGINNRLPDFALRIDTRQVAGNYLRTADNVDIDDAGRIRRREGEALVQAMVGAHSLYMISDTAGYMVRDSVLYQITLPEYAEVYLSNLGSNASMSWELYGNELFYSNGCDTGRIVRYLLGPGLEVSSAVNFAYATPPAPEVSVIAGSLPAGTYQVAVSYANIVTGFLEEGGLSASTNVTLTTPGGIRVVAPEWATIGGYPGDANNPSRDTKHVAQWFNVYVSSENGSTPMYAVTSELDLGEAETKYPYEVNLNAHGATATFSLPFGGNVPQMHVNLTLPTTGREASTRFEEPLPAGTLFVSNGRLCSFKDNMVYVGLPYRPGYYLPLDGFIPFPAPVSIAIENQGGTFIAADKTYWVPGDLGDVKDTIATVLPYGAVPGTSFSTPNKSLVGWFGNEGFVIGKTNGEVEAVMSDNITLTPPTSGCSTIRTTKGYRRVVGAGWCLNLENNAATTYSDFNFTSLSGGYGTKLDGIYALTGSNAVDAKVGFGKLDFKTEELKHLPYVYMGVSSPEPLEMNVVCPDRKGVLQDFTYPARSCGAELSMQRVDIGKGLRSSWFDLTVYNQSGSEFTLASVSFTPLASGRRI